MTLLELARAFDATPPEGHETRSALTEHMRPFLGDRAGEYYRRYSALAERQRPTQFMPSSGVLLGHRYLWPAETTVLAMGLAVETPTFYRTDFHHTLGYCGCIYAGAVLAELCDSHKRQADLSE